MSCSRTLHHKLATLWLPEDCSYLLSHFRPLFRNFQAVIHDFSFHWGINMRWDRDHIPLLIHQHGKEYTNQMRKKCVELHKTGNGYKKATHLKMLISTIGAILKVKQLELLQTCLEEAFYFAPVHSEQDDKRGKKSPRIAVGELQRKVAPWGHQVSKTTSPSCQQIIWKACQKKPFHVIFTCHFKCKCLEFAKRYRNFDWNRVLWSDVTKL